MQGKLMGVTPSKKSPSPYSRKPVVCVRVVRAVRGQLQSFHETDILYNFVRYH